MTIELSLSIFLALCFSTYFTQLLLLLAAGRRIREPSPSGSGGMVSVVIAARNEEENIGPCLEALSRQDYAEFEVIVVDDRSADRTAQMVDGFCGIRRLRLIRIARNESNLSGKQNAIEAGIGRAQGEIVLCTDADCRVRPNWISSMVPHLLSRKADFVFGRTRIAPMVTVLQKFQALELDLLFRVALALQRLGLPGSCMGNNIGFRKESYARMGGQLAMGYQAAEDCAMLARFKKTGLRVASVPEPLVETPAEKSAMTYARQQIRWLCGGLRGPLAWASLPAVIANLSIWLVPWFPWLVLAWIIKTGIELSFGFRNTQRQLKPLVPPILALFAVLSPALLFLSLFKRKTVWKSDSIQVRA